MVGLLSRIAEKALRKIGDLRVADASQTPYTDIWSTQRAPTELEVLEAYREAAFFCANLNARSVASVNLRMMVTSGPNEPDTTRHSAPVSHKMMTALKGASIVSKKVMGARRVDEVLEHPWLQIMEAVNPLMDGTELMELTSIYMDTYGRCYWWLPRNVFGLPGSIWPLSPHTVEVKRKGKTALIDKYVIKVGVDEDDIDPADVIMFRGGFDLKEPYFGTWSSLRAGFESFRLVERDIAQAAALLENESRPGMIVSPKDTEDALGIPQAKRLELELRRRFRRGSRGDVWVSRTPLDIQQPSMTSKDQESLQRAQASKTMVANAFDVPIALLEAKNINRATLEAAIFQHAKYGVKPRVTRIVQKINQMVMPRYGERFFMWFDDPVPDDVELEEKLREKRLKNYVTVVNEEREELNMPPVDWGDRPLAPSSVSKLETDEERQDRLTRPKPQPGQPSDPNAQDQEDEVNQERAVSTLIDHYTGRIGRKQAIALLVKKAGVDFPRAFDLTERQRFDPVKFVDPGHGRSLPNGTALAVILRDVFAEQRARVLTTQKRAILACTKAPLDPIDLSDWNPELQRRAFPAIQVEVERGGKDAVARLGVSDAVTFQVTDPSIKRAIDDLSFKFADSTNATTTKEINTALAELRRDFAAGLLSESNLPTEITKIVSNIFERAEEHRAARIALTESSRAVHMGQRLLAEQAGGLVVGYKWLLSSDACPFCKEIAARNKQGIALNGTFGAADSYQNGPKTASVNYNDIPHPPAHPYCKCTMIEVINQQAMAELGLENVDLSF